MDNKFERFIVTQTSEGVKIDFNNQRTPIYVPLFIILIVVGIVLFVIGSMDLLGFSFLLILSASFILIGL